jgi:hypothetical protein
MPTLHGLVGFPCQTARGTISTAAFASNSPGKAVVTSKFKKHPIDKHLKRQPKFTRPAPFKRHKQKNPTIL